MNRSEGETVRAAGPPVCLFCADSPGSSAAAANSIDNAARSFARRSNCAPSPHSLPRPTTFRTTLSDGSYDYC
ncbi:hypothetical protein PUN28_019011 [Cardiocondyla obscurior]|uniref:Uncharacterized protein n=1 Tax=Cardiocondyla obscurior TaxID=286306 RepID=A0AAW2ECZ8_9HYME